MNVEQFFVQSLDTQKVSDLIRQRIKLSPDAAGKQPDWGLPSSYDVVLAKDLKRKIALSSSVGGWMSGIESKEFVDFALLQYLSEALHTNVIAVQLSEVSGCCGYAMCSRGTVTERRFSEDDVDPAGVIALFLKRNGVQSGLISFKEAVRARDQGWQII
jgi:hypothetical protein